MTLRLMTVCTVCMLLAACRQGSQEAPHTEAAPRAAQAPHEEAPNVVEVDESALRDLRVTTRPVASRTGGDLVVLLGELSVDQNTYAEVGTPVPARVVRLLANAGDSVKAGQTLADMSSPELSRERAEYLSANARLRLAEAALERKRALAAEKIAPLREVQAVSYTHLTLPTILLV